MLKFQGDSVARPWLICSSAQATVDGVPESYFFTGTFAGAAGVEFPLPKHVDSINDYAVLVLPKGSSGTIGEIYYTKGLTSFFVKNSGADVATGFDAILWYFGSHNLFGTSWMRRYYASPSSTITDHGDAAQPQSIAAIAAAITGAGAKAILELPGNAVYNFRRNYVLSSDVALKSQPGALLNTSYSIRNASYQWTASGSTPGAYYLEEAGGDWTPT